VQPLRGADTRWREVTTMAKKKAAKKKK